ncbi:uncharacterized protein LOC134431425 [Melospiza melodia melodia]|uniref:uncharacterized protein LOC134431425 n=1 Tax=Melospiza melodia melodia TaxID=1914991 RepID=UPI002FD3B62B
MAQWGVTIDIPDSPQHICTAAIEQQRPTQKLKWITDKPVQVKQWPLSKQKIKVLEELVEEQLKKGHIVETMSPWNSPVFVIQKADKKRWRLLCDLRQINNVIEDMGSPQPGMPSPTMLPQDWKLAVIDIKDCFFQIPLHPDDAPRFAFSVPSINMESPMKRYHWTVLPQGLKVSPAICQWYVSSLLSPVRAAAEAALSMLSLVPPLLPPLRRSGPGKGGLDFRTATCMGTLGMCLASLSPSLSFSLDPPTGAEAAAPDLGPRHAETRPWQFRHRASPLLRTQHHRQAGEHIRKPPTLQDPGSTNPAPSPRQRPMQTTPHAASTGCICKSLPNKLMPAPGTKKTSL